jgi:hypothetical protein
MFFLVLVSLQIEVGLLIERGLLSVLSGEKVELFCYEGT